MPAKPTTPADGTGNGSARRPGEAEDARCRTGRSPSRRRRRSRARASPSRRCRRRRCPGTCRPRRRPSRSLVVAEAVDAGLGRCPCGRAEPPPVSRRPRPWTGPTARAVGDSEDADAGPAPVEAVVPRSVPIGGASRRGVVGRGRALAEDDVVAGRGGDGRRPAERRGERGLRRRPGLRRGWRGGSGARWCRWPPRASLGWRARGRCPVHRPDGGRVPRAHHPRWAARSQHPNGVLDAPDGSDQSRPRNRENHGRSAIVRRRARGRWAARNRSRPARATGRSSRPNPIRTWLPSWPMTLPGRRRTPSASTSRAANDSDGLVVEQPGEADRAAARPDPRPAVGMVDEEAVEQRQVVVDDPARPGEDGVARPEPDQGEDLGRRRRADRRVVLERGAAREQVAVAGREPADPQAGHRERLRHHAERDAAVERVGAGGQAVGLVELEEAVDLVGEEVDPAIGQLAGRAAPTRRASAACPSGCAAR